MDRRSLIGLLFICCLSVSPAMAQYEVVPLPQDIGLQQGEPFVIDNTVQIIAPDDLQREAAFLQSYLKDLTSLTLPIAKKRDNKVRYINLSVAPTITPSEAYHLTVNQKDISIIGGSAAGVFYGIQTLRKTLGLKVTNAAFPAVIVKDAPRFSWRGMHLDCSRHFWSVDFIKKFIDLLALHNMNVFHWHLTDDQGWRIEIRKWPKLTEVGSQRSGTIIGTNSDLDDNIPYGGFYTQAEAREIVRYAAERHITVVPEIDMPGHMLAALASYPELGCTGGPYQVGHYWGVYKDVLCIGNPKVYEFVQDVLTEIMDIFPSEVIHIGGDEAPSDRWQQCEKCKDAYLKDVLEGRLGADMTSVREMPMTSVREMPMFTISARYQGLFTRRIFNFLASKGRRALGWDEILDGSPRNAMIMSWRGTEGGAKAAATGHDVIMTPTSYCYFDYQQVEDTQFEPSRCSGFIPIEKVYNFDPAPDYLSEVARSHILGVQANLWTEYMTSESMVEYQALPRMSALAEVQWTQPGRKDYNAFWLRLTRLTKLFELYHYTYAKHLWPERQIPNRWQF
ncbi:MAG: beta-N-acetylhexosaminidase [Prevotella sp.]|nr:beta-N-acetylhexosaminidase [Prevotella sp.]